VNIIDNSAKVAIYTTAPHPDIAAIKNAVGVSGIIPDVNFIAGKNRWIV